MANTSRFHELVDVIHGGLENLHKWYNKTDDTDAYFICLGKCSSELIRNDHYHSFSALNPTWRTAYTKQRWDKEAHEKGLY
jgi:hypothetical protein